MSAAKSLTHVSNEDLWSATLAANATRREAVARLVAHLAEVERRGLHLREGYSSLYDLCVRGLSLSEGNAHRNISAARIARRYPGVTEMLADGRLHLTGLSLLAGRLTDENHHELLEEAAGKTKAEILVLLARWFPKPDIPDRVEPVSRGSSPSGQTGSLGLGGGTSPPRPNVEPLSENRFAVHFSGSAQLKEKLEHARNLMSHVSLELEVVFERALDALIRELENKRWGKTDRPRRSQKADTKDPPREARRNVYDRDRAQCTYVSPSGVRCAKRAFLQWDHIQERALGGSEGQDNGRLRCGAHNRMTARQTFGDSYVDRAIRLRQRNNPQAERPPSAPKPAETHSKLLAALTSLGFKKTEAKQALAKLGNAPELSFEQLLRSALALLVPG